MFCLVASKFIYVILLASQNYTHEKTLQRHLYAIKIINCQIYCQLLYYAIYKSTKCQFTCIHFIVLQLRLGFLQQKLNKFGFLNRVNYTYFSCGYLYCYIYYNIVWEKYTCFTIQVLTILKFSIIKQKILIMLL